MTVRRGSAVLHELLTKCPCQANFGSQIGLLSILFLELIINEQLVVDFAMDTGIENGGNIFLISFMIVIANQM